MSGEGRGWMRLPRSSRVWQEKLREFLDIKFGDSSRGGTAVCSCPRCVCMAYRSRSVVQIHLLSRGFDENFIDEKGQYSDVVLQEEGQPAAVEVHNETPPPADVEVDNEVAPHEVGVDNNVDDAASDARGATNLIRSLI